MYEPKGFALQIFNKRYTLHDGESWIDACKRLSRCIASAEDKDVTIHEKEFFDILSENLFCPAGRVWYGASRLKSQLLNCFVIPTGDSREGWGETVKNMIIISGTGGGLGINFSPIRPKGSPISGHKGTATGSNSLMHIMNSAGDVMKAGGGRRVALMFALNLNHPDIEEFLDRKLDMKEFNNANVSVNFNDDPEKFFEKVRNDEDIDLKFAGRVVMKVSARKLWDKMISNALKSAEPGLLNGYYANRMNNTWYCNDLICCNPCVTGDTLVAVADGRNAISIRQLEEEGKDVPVYSIHPGTGQVEIKWGVNPRKTGKNKEIWKLTLDDGSIIRATPDHKFMLKDRSFKELRYLKSGDSLMPFNTRKDRIYRHIDGVCGGSPYGKMSGRQYRLIYEFHNGKREKMYHIHHRDFNSLNDNIDNLIALSVEDHKNLHVNKMKGSNNPYYRMSDEWKRNFVKGHFGAENGMFGKENKWGHHSDETKKRIAEKHLGKKHSEKTKKLLSEIRISNIKKKYEDADIPQFIIKECPMCNVRFNVHWNEREKTYCSRKCFVQYMNTRKEKIEENKVYWANKRESKRQLWLKLYSQVRFEIKRHLLKNEWIDYLKSHGLSARFGNATFRTLNDLQKAAETYNHKVVSAEFDGYEDVYNITVEDNHNYCIISSNNDESYITSSGICSANCGEIWLGSYECCCLGSLVLTRFVKQDGKIDWELLRKTVSIAVRFLDNVLTVNQYPIQEIREVCSRLRRIGLGVMGLHDMLLMMGHKYSSPEGLEVVDKVMEFIKNSAYEASIELAKEKGPFPLFVGEKFLKGGFAKTLKPSIRNAIKEYGLRNCALMTLPPTGTTSIISNVSSGIEPMFAPAYIRKFRDGDELKSEIVIHELFKSFVDEGKSVEHFQGVYDLCLRDHFEMQLICQKHVDNAISKTINVMPGTSNDELSELYMEYFPELKGVTIYVDGSREDQPLTPLSIDEAIAAMKGKSEKIIRSYSRDACKDGMCDI